MLLGVLSRLIAGVTLIDRGHRHRLTPHGLHLVGQLFDLCSILFIGRGDVQRQQMTQRVHFRSLGLSLDLLRDYLQVSLIDTHTRPVIVAPADL